CDFRERRDAARASRRAVPLLHRDSATRAAARRELRRERQARGRTDSRSRSDERSFREERRRAATTSESRRPRRRRRRAARRRGGREWASFVLLRREYTPPNGAYNRSCPTTR